MRNGTGALLAMLLTTAAGANEVTVKNDSLVNGSSGVIESGFATAEKAAAWLTSPCNGNIVAAQIYWHSATGTADQSIESAVEIFRSGSFPDPGMLTATIGGPVMNDGVFNEFRFLDENNTIPLSVPVVQNEVFIVSFQFNNPPPQPEGPSVVRDTDGNPGGRNTIYGDVGLGLDWYDSKTLGVNGDWAIRAVVDCQSVVTMADVRATASAAPALYTPGQLLTYTLVISNAGPAASPNTTIIDTFPGAYTSAAWSCTPSGGAGCNGSSGVGNIVASNVSLPSGSSVTYTVNGNVANGTTGTLSNSVTAAVGSPANDPDTSNNTGTADTSSISDRIFADDFEP